MPAKKKKAETAAPIVAYKGFNQDLACRNFQYVVGQTYTHNGEVRHCSSGFHACENPLDIFNYYKPGESRFALVELGGKVSRETSGDTKIAAGEITIKAELKIPEIVTAAVNWITAAAKALTTDENANAATSGNYANAATSGNYANAATSGNYANAATSGNYANAATSGYRANAATSGYRANAATSGNCANAATSGNYANAATSGNYANAATSGNYANAATSGDGANAATSGEGAVAAALGFASKAKAGPDGAIVLVARDGWNGKILAIRASKVGENGIKPDTWYQLNAKGEFEETEE